MCPRGTCSRALRRSPVTAEIWMVSAEARPLAQTGGLADVLSALPDALARRPDILHVHDWHAALVPLLVWLGRAGEPSPRTVLTIHNLGYQGEFPARELDWLFLSEAQRRQVFHVDGIEFYGGINFLKAGIVYSDALTTVSPTYAREILTPEFGCRLDGPLRWQTGKLRGILNGADYTRWDPSSDATLLHPYGPG